MLIDSPHVDGELKYVSATIPSSDQTLVDKSYVDGIISSLDVKNSVRAATTSTLTLSGLQTIDGVALSAGDRVLVKNQANQAQNGIYTWATGGTVLTEG